MLVFFRTSKFTAFLLRVCDCNMNKGKPYSSESNGGWGAESEAAVQMVTEPCVQMVMEAGMQSFMWYTI